MVYSHWSTPGTIAIPTTIIMASTLICRVFHTALRPCHWCHWLLLVISSVSLHISLSISLSVNYHSSKVNSIVAITNYCATMIILFAKGFDFLVEKTKTKQFTLIGLPTRGMLSFPDMENMEFTQNIKNLFYTRDIRQTRKLLRF